MIGSEWAWPGASRLLNKLQPGQLHRGHAENTPASPHSWVAGLTWLSGLALFLDDFEAVTPRSTLMAKSFDPLSSSSSTHEKTSKTGRAVIGCDQLGDVGSPKLSEFVLPLLCGHWAWQESRQPSTSIYRVVTTVLLMSALRMISPAREHQTSTHSGAKDVDNLPKAQLAFAPDPIGTTSASARATLDDPARAGKFRELQEASRQVA